MSAYVRSDDAAADATATPNSLDESLIKFKNLSVDNHKLYVNTSKKKYAPFQTQTNY